MSFGKNQLSNITNNNLISNANKIFRKNDGQHARSAARELELQQKLKLQTGLKEKENNNNTTEDTQKHLTQVHLTDAELSAKKKEFTQCVFYLDNLEATTKASIERAIVLLGASQEQFFSRKCTHLITTKIIPPQENMLRTYSDTSKQKYKKALTEFKPRDSIVENALSWGIVLWSADVMLKTVSYFLKATSYGKNKQSGKKGLGKVLQEEKLFGPSTGVNNETHSKRPHYVPFTGYFLSVEDATQIHRPIVSKQYTEHLFTKKPSDYPWPFLKPTPNSRSPFGKRAPPAKKDLPPPPPPSPNITNASIQITTPPATPTKSTTLSTQTPKPTQPSATAATATAAAAQPPNHIDSQLSLRASGYQQSCINTTRSVSVLPNEKRLPPGESVNRLDKRMVENITQNEHQKLCKQVVKEQENRARKEKEKKKELRYCENCNRQFEKLEEHMKDKTHQTFIRDQNNFKVLDALLEKIHRPYKEPLPDNWKNLIDPKIDGKNVKFVSDVKRPRIDDLVETPNKLDSLNMLKKQATHPVQELGWDQYSHVFH